MKYNYSKTQIEKVLKDCDSYCDVLRALNIPIQGNNTKTLKNKIEEYGLDVSHFSHGYKSKKIIKKPIEEYLKENISIKSHSLKSRLIKEGFKENKCELCGQLPEHNGKLLVLQLDHINGNHTDNRLENLRILCPNCHSQTETFSCKKDKKHYYCPDCGKEITSRAKYCFNCSIKYRNSTHVSNKPSKEELLSKFEELQTIIAVGKFYGVSDSAVKKWFISYNLPHTVKEIRHYINNAT